MTSTTVSVTAATVLALAVLVVRLRRPERRTPVAAGVELTSITMSAVLLADLVIGTGSWVGTVGTVSLYTLFGLTVALSLGMGRAAGAAIVARQRRSVPFDAIVSFGTVCAVAAGLAGAMVLAAEGGVAAGVVAVVAVLRVLASRTDLHQLAQSWRWDDRPGTV